MGHQRRDEGIAAGSEAFEHGLAGPAITRLIADIEPKGGVEVPGNHLPNRHPEAAQRSKCAGRFVPRQRSPKISPCAPQAVGTLGSSAALCDKSARRRFGLVPALSS